MYLNALVIAALTLGGGGTVLAAQHSIPGDTLYPVKISVNESVRAAFAVGANAEARLAADLLAERVEEAQALAGEGRLDAEAEARVIAQSQATSRALAQADAGVQADIRAGLRTELAAFRSETAAGAAAGIAEEESLDLSAVIDTALGIIVSGGSDTEIAGNVNIAARAEDAESRIAGIRNAVDAGAELSAEAEARVGSSLGAAAAYIADARASLAADAAARAEASLDAAVLLIEELEMLVQPTAEVRGTVDIEGTTGGNDGEAATGSAGASVNIGGGTDIGL